MLFVQVSFCITGHLVFCLVSVRQHCCLDACCLKGITNFLPISKNFIRFQKFHSQNVFQGILSNCDFWTLNPSFGMFSVDLVSHTFLDSLHLFTSLFVSSCLHLHIVSSLLTLYLLINLPFHLPTGNKITVKLNHIIRWDTTQCW